MIIFAKIRISIDYSVFILLNVQPAAAFCMKSSIIWKNSPTVRV